jgi:hypothetical protein
MNTSFIIRCSAIAAVALLVAITSTAAAGHLPRPLGAGEQPLSAGVHVLDLVSREQGRPGYKHFPRITVALPSGWFNYNGWGLNNGDNLSVSFWDVDRVYPTGCQWQGKPKIDPGRTVNGLARALATRPLRHASKPTAVALAGFHGKYLRWSVPCRSLDQVPDRLAADDFFRGVRPGGGRPQRRLDRLLDCACACRRLL